MQIFIFITIGIIGGVFGGLGMGGGTLLIPLLVSFTALNQHTAQTINLIAFIPMAIIVLIIHIKNGLVKFKHLLTISLPALLTAILAAFLAFRVQSGNLKIYFGIFLLVLGIYQLTTLIIKTIKEKKAKNNVVNNVVRQFTILDKK